MACCLQLAAGLLVEGVLGLPVAEALGRPLARTALLQPSGGWSVACQQAKVACLNLTCRVLRKLSRRRRCAPATPYPPGSHRTPSAWPTHVSLHRKRRRRSGSARSTRSTRSTRRSALLARRIPAPAPLSRLAAQRRLPRCRRRTPRLRTLLGQSVAAHRKGPR